MPSSEIPLLDKFLFHGEISTSSSLPNSFLLRNYWLEVSLPLHKSILKISPILHWVAGNQKYSSGLQCWEATNHKEFVPYHSFKYKWVKATPLTSISFPKEYLIQKVKSAHLNYTSSFHPRTAYSSANSLKVYLVLVYLVYIVLL